MPQTHVLITSKYHVKKVAYYTNFDMSSNNIGAWGKSSQCKGSGWAHSYDLKKPSKPDISRIDILLYIWVCNSLT